MSTHRLRTEIKWLRRYTFASSLLFTVLVVTAFQQRGRAQFETIDVERLNVRTKDGKYVVVIANRERMPGIMTGGKERALTQARAGGMLFYNRDGDEAGGLIFDNSQREAADVAFGQLSLDRYGSDQVAALRYVEEPTGWVSGLEVSHFPKGGTAEFFNARDSILELPEAARAAALEELRRRTRREGKGEIKRLFAGQQGRTALLRLNDTQGRRRVQLIVDSLDVARLEFFDERGNVIRRIPE